MLDTPNPPFPPGRSHPNCCQICGDAMHVTADCPARPPEPLPGMLAALQSCQEASRRAMSEGQGYGLTTRQMAQHLERESGYRDLVDALERMLNENPPFRIGFKHTELCTQADNCGCEVAQARAALAKARGDKPDAT